MISIRFRVLIGLAAVALAAIVVFGDAYFHQTLGLPRQSIRVFATLAVLIVVVAILWWSTLRDHARRPDKSASPKDREQRS